MSWTLLRKELRQHWLGLLVVLVSGAMLQGLIVAISRFADHTATPFEGLRSFTLVMSFLGALVLNHRLVVTEYQARTQLFLEALPVARWRMVAVKYVLGLGILLLLVSGAWSLAILLAWSHEPLPARFGWILLARSLSFAWVAHSFFFLMGLSGRYRFAVYLILILAWAFVSEHKAFDFERFGPFALVDMRFAYERELVPWLNLFQSWGLILVFTSAAAGLSLLREGSVAALLAEKMSHREKVLIVALVCGLLFAVTTLSEKTKKAPFDLADAATASGPGVSVKVASGLGEKDPAARTLARSVAAELVSMREYLDIRELPPVYIVRRRDLDANRYERGELEESEGVHVRANFTAPQWQDRDFLAWLAPEVLAAASHDRVKLESQRWILDGFGAFWVGRNQHPADLAKDQSLALRAIYGTAEGFALADLHQWLRFRERVGEGVAAGVAWSGLKTLVRTHGAESCQKFLQAVLALGQAKDFRASLDSRTWEHHLREQTGADPATFFKAWQTELATARAALAATLAAIPRLKGEVDFIPLSAHSRKARFRLSLDPAPPAEVRYSLLHRRLGAFDEEIDLKSLQREQATCQTSAEIEPPESFSQRQRVYWSFALDVPALGCPVVSGFKRQEVP